MFDPSIPSPLSAFSAAVAELVRGAAPSVVSVKSQHSQSSGFVWRPGLVVAAEEALADDGEIEIVAHDGARDPGRACRPRSVDRRRAFAR